LKTITSTLPRSRTWSTLPIPEQEDIKARVGVKKVAGGIHGDLKDTSQALGEILGLKVGPAVMEATEAMEDMEAGVAVVAGEVMPDIMEDMDTVTAMEDTEDGEVGVTKFTTTADTKAGDGEEIKAVGEDGAAERKPRKLRRRPPRRRRRRTRRPTRREVDGDGKSP